MANSSTSHRAEAYLDTCVFSQGVKNQLGQSDADAMVQICSWVEKSELTICTSTVALEELEKIPEPFQLPHIDAYNAVRTLAGSEQTVVLDGSTVEGTHPTLQRLRDVLDENDARHVFQAHQNGVKDFITTDRRTILNRAPQIEQIVDVRVRSPAEFAAYFNQPSTESK